MSSKNLTVFETTYEKVLSIINKVKDFIKKNTQNFDKIIDDLEWVRKVIINKTLYTYEVSKEKLSEGNTKFSDFITKYNEELLNLNKKHVLVRDILSITTNKEFAKKPSLVLQKFSTDELTKENYYKNESKNLVLNPLGKWILDIYHKSHLDDARENNNRNLARSIETSNRLNLPKEYNQRRKETKSLTSYKNRNINRYKDNNMHMSTSLTSITNNKNSIEENKDKDKNKNKTNKSNKINRTRNKNNNIMALMKNKKINLYSTRKAMERYFKNEMEQKRKKNMQKSLAKDKNKTNNTVKITNPQYLNNLINKNFEFMKTITDKNFNIFNLKKLVGQKNVLPLMCHFMFKILGLINPKIICIKKLIPFLTTVSEGYLETTLYHNSLHGADVCHSLFIYVLNSNIEEICETSILDLLGLIVSSAGHDLGHPGFNNNFHINTSSEIALTYNDISVLENFHTATLFRIVRKEENNIFEKMDINNYKHIRKRIVNQILATDMVNHAMILSSVKAKITAWQLDNNPSENSKFMFLSGVEKTKFDEQQMMLNYLIHAADLAHNTQKFEISLQWVEILTYEFWKQGDIEREKHLNISFLCDRNNVDIPASQIGFLKGFILSTFDILRTMFPSLSYTLENAKNNIKEWQKLVDQKRKTGWTPPKKKKDKDETEKSKV